jgi:hypothetical protein
MISVKFKKALIVACGVTFITLFSLFILLGAYYYDYRPAGPQPDQGSIYATEVYKGSSVYLTGKEQLVYELIPPAIAVSFTVGLLLNAWWKQFPSRKEGDSVLKE